MKRFLTRRNIIILIVLLVIGGGLYWRNRSAAQNAEPVRTATVTRGEVKGIVPVSGKVVADKQVMLNFQTPGKLAYVGAKIGDEVKAGQTVLALDTGDLGTAVQVAYNRYLAADANAKQIEDDVKNHETNENFAMKNVRVNAQTARDIAYDAWLQAKRDQSKAYLVAPFNGYVTEMTVNAPGDIVGVMDGVTVVSPSGLHFEGEVDETDIGEVKVGQQVEATLDAFPGKTFTGVVSTIGFASRLSSTGANVYPVKITFKPEDEKDLRLGMNGDADIVTAVAQNVLELPAEAVVDGEVTLPGEPEQKKKVVTGIEGENDVEIKEGLNEGDVVIVR